MALDLSENGSGLVEEPSGNVRNLTQHVEDPSGQVRNHSCTCVMLQCGASDTFLGRWRRRDCSVHPFKTHQDCPCPRPFTLYPLPRPRVERRKWLKIVNRKDPKTGLMLAPRQPHVCSKHFKGGGPSEDHPYPTLNLGYELEAMKPDILEQVYDQSRILPRSILENEENPFSALELQPGSDDDSSISSEAKSFQVKVKSEPRSENGSDYGDRKRSLEDRLLETENPESGVADANSSILNSGTDISNQGSDDSVSVTKRRKIKEEPPDAYECDTDEYDADSSETTITTAKPEADVKKTLQIKIEPIDVEISTSGSEKASPMALISKAKKGGAKSQLGGAKAQKGGSNVGGAVTGGLKSMFTPVSIGERGKFMPLMTSSSGSSKFMPLMTSPSRSIITETRVPTHREKPGETTKIPAVRCAVIKCEIGSYGGKRVHCSYHKSWDCVCVKLYPFPSNLAERKRWLVLMNRRSASDPSKYYNPDSTSVVCGRHFPEGRPTVFYPFPTLHLGYSPLPTDTYHSSLVRYPWFQAPSVMIQRSQVNRDKTWLTQATQTETEALVLTRFGTRWCVADALQISQSPITGNERILQPRPVPVGEPVPVINSIYDVPSTSRTSVDDVIAVRETEESDRSEREIFSALEKSPAEEFGMLGESDPMMNTDDQAVDFVHGSRQSELLSNTSYASSSRSEGGFPNHQPGSGKALTKIAPKPPAHRLTMP